MEGPKTGEKVHENRRTGTSERFEQMKKIPRSIEILIYKFAQTIQLLLGSELYAIILYGSYARGDLRPDSDIDIIILVDMSDIELKSYGEKLSYMTYDFNLDHDIDIKPIAKSEEIFNKWVVNYPFYSNIHKEGVILYGAA